MFELTNNQADDFVTVTSIQDKQGYNNIRQSLSKQYSATSFTPDIQIVNANLKGSRELELMYTPHDGSLLVESTKPQVLDHLKYLWGYDVTIDELSTLSNGFDI